MDMSGAQKTANKLRDFVQSVATSDSKLYDKSKQKLQDIASICSEIVTAVSHILQSEVLQTEHSEFESAPDANIYTQVAEMREELDKLKAFVQGAAQVESAAPNNSIEPVDTPESRHAQLDVKPATHTDKLPPDKMKEIVSTYGSVLKEAASTDCGVPAGNQLTGILWKWFNARIFTKYTNAPTFHYGVHRFKHIIYAFTVLYGKHFEENTVDVFLRYFEDWIDELSTSSESHRWIAPYEVYQIERNMDSSHANLTSVVLYDVLITTVLKPLLEYNSNGYYLHDSGLYDTTYQADPSCLDEYVCYTYDSRILESLNLVQPSIEEGDD